MGHIPPPHVLSKEQWEVQGERDFAFDKWYRYESNPFGLFLWLKDKLQKRECPNAFAQLK
jgi:hypothetical protein